MCGVGCGKGAKGGDGLHHSLVCVCVRVERGVCVCVCTTLLVGGWSGFVTCAVHDCEAMFSCCRCGLNVVLVPKHAGPHQHHLQDLPAC